MIGEPNVMTLDNDISLIESDDTRFDREAVATLRDAVAGADLVAPPVALPDFHQEKDMEVPCSIAVATREMIRPSLGNASVNCGMALVAFDAGRPTDAAMGAFFRRVRERYPAPPRNRPELSSRDVRRAARDGAKFAVDRFGVDPTELARVEEFGVMDLEPYGGAERLRRELPRLIVQLARLQFGSIGPSNHFVELQQVEAIYEPEIAAALGVELGQTTLQYHAGGGVLTGLIGRMFGRRMDFPSHHRAIMALQKPLLHLASARSREQYRLRKALYFGDGCPPIARDSEEGRRVMLANAAAMNYGFAYRLAVYANLRRLAAETLGTAEGRLIVDSPHDTLYEETIAGERAIVHRYKTSRAYPASGMQAHPIFGRTGQPVLLPGTNRTSSLLCVADEGAAGSLYSSPHGTGTIVADLASDGRSGLDPLGRHTVRYGYSDAAPTAVPQLDDRGIDAALSVLVSNRIVKPVARLRPMAVLT